MPTDPPVGDSPPSYRAGIDFLRIELETAISLLHLSVTESQLGDREAVSKARNLAQDAYDNFQRFWPAVEKHLSDEKRSQIKQLQDKVEELLLNE